VQPGGAGRRVTHPFLYEDLPDTHFGRLFKLMDSLKVVAVKIDIKTEMSIVAYRELQHVRIQAE